MELRSRTKFVSIVVAATLFGGCSDGRDEDPGGRPAMAPSPSSTRIRPLSIIDVGETPAWLGTGFGAIWVGSHRGAKVTRIDPSTEETISIPAGGNVIGTVAGAGGVWYLAWTAKRLEKIDPRTNKIVARIDVNSEGGDFEFDGNRLWFAGNQTIFGIDGKTNEIMREIPCGQPGPSCAIDVYRGALWAVKPEGTEFVRLIKGSRPSVDRIAIGRGAYTVDSFFDDLWVAYPERGMLRRYDFSSGELVAEIDTGEHPDSMAEGAGKLFVRTSDRTIATIDPATNAIVATYRGLPAAEAPIGALVFFDGLLWAGNFTDGTVWKIAP